MALSQRSAELYRLSREKGLNPPESTFDDDFHRLGRTRYARCPQWEKIARSMADAIVAMPVYIEPSDRLIGRVYHLNNRPVERREPDFDYLTAPYRRLCAEIPGYEELVKNNLSGSVNKGHVTWMWEQVLRLGTSGIRRRAENALANARDREAEAFCTGALILLDALDAWNEKHADALEERGMNDLAAICRRVPKYPARTFHEAVQAFFMQHIVVMRENPFGGNSPGRLDYYLWPYLRSDLESGACTAEEARELIDELFLRIDERIHGRDTWDETIVVGGVYPNGLSSVNPLSYIMIESMMEMDLTHPSLYVRLSKSAPEAFVKLCVRYLRKGGNKAQVYNDEAVIAALTDTGIPYVHAVEYTANGCMEIAVQGMHSDFLCNTWQNIPLIAELCLTGGVRLLTGERVSSVRAPGLTACATFDAFYRSFLDELKRILDVFFRAQDEYSREAERARPSYLISCLIEECLARGRNMHGGGALYHDYGAVAIGLPDAADALFAVKKAVFDEGFCSAGELLDALRADYEGYDALRARLLAVPKYGQENAEADGFAARVFADVCRAYTARTNRFVGRCKPFILNFIWGPEAGAMLGASPNGNLRGKPVAQGITPQSSSMTKGLTAAMNSCLTAPFTCFCGGATTMWDLDPSWASDEVVRDLLLTFFEGGGQIFQGNMTDAAELLRAMEKPEDYYHLIVRVGGFSARFVGLSPALQREIIARTRHAG